MIPLGKLIEFDAPVGMDPKTLMVRGPLLVSAAFALGAKHGCRVVDDAYALDFRWRFKDP
jgi:hypothetical protein